MVVRAAAPRDRGSNLVEVVITIVLVGSVLTALLMSVSATISSSNRSLDAAETTTVLQNVVDSIDRAPTSCDYTSYAEAAVQWYGWPATGVTVQHQRYVPNASITIPGQWVPGACEADRVTPLLVQRLVITVRSPDGTQSDSIEMVKSDV